MAQPILQRLHKLLSERIGDEITDYTADGLTVKAVKRNEAINDALIGIYNDKLKIFRDEDKNNGDRNFANTFTEYTDETTVVLTRPPSVSTAALPLAANIITVLSMSITASLPYINAKAEKITQTLSYRANKNKYDNFKATAEKPRYIQKSSTLKIDFGSVGAYTTIQTGTIKYWSLYQPVQVDISLTGNDVVMPRIWEREVIDKAEEILKK